MTFFQEEAFVVPKTEGIKYAGSKRKLLPQIFDVVKGLGGKSFLDGFSGTTRVAQAFAKSGYAVTANDISYWSECFGKCYLQSEKEDSYYQEIIDILNSLEGEDGFLTENYGGDESRDEKKPFLKKNTRKADAIRRWISELKVDEKDKAVLLTSLILALDSVDSTLGHYAAYISKWPKRAYNDLFLRLPFREKTKEKHRVTRKDIFDLLSENTIYDIAYFDPPYGSNNEKMPPSRIRYASYYHIWTSIVKNDNPKVFGKANRREDTRDLIAGSVFEEFRKNEAGNYIAMEAIRKMIQQTKAKYILLSYSSGGRATKEELNDIIHSAGELEKVLEIDYKKNVMAGMRWTNEWVPSDEGNKEYLFLMKKKEFLHKKIFSFDTKKVAVF
jgi:adenine-specific DNA-methyltransferase